MALRTVERIWIDLETTGLGEERDDVIMEIGTILTDKFGDEIDRFTSPVYSIGWRSLLQTAVPLVQTMHETSGLVQELTTLDPMLISPPAVERMVLDFYQSYEVPVGELPMCGATVHFDRRFVMWQMPNLFKVFHYRNIDVSTIVGLARDLNPNVYEAAPKKRDKHRAIPDLEDSIDQYKFYLDNFLHVAAEEV